MFSLAGNNKSDVMSNAHGACKPTHKSMLVTVIMLNVHVMLTCATDGGSEGGLVKDHTLSLCSLHPFLIVWMENVNVMLACDDGDVEKSRWQV